MSKKYKLLVCCGNGAGTSMMIKLNAERMTKKMGHGCTGDSSLCSV